MVGREREIAIEKLTPRQLQAYGYRREGHAWKWIARRMGVSHPRVIQHVAAAEKRLGYELTVTAKQRTPYKSAAQRRVDAYRAGLRSVVPPIRAMSREERRRFIRQIDSSAQLRGISEHGEIRLLAFLCLEATSDEGAATRLRKRLEDVERQRRQEQRVEMHVVQPGEFEAQLEADYGINGSTGKAFVAADFVVDDGKGYDRV